MRSSPLAACVALSACLALAGCADNPSLTEDASTSGMDGSTPTSDGGGIAPGTRCGASNAPCCAGRICELGLRCGGGDVCCIQPGGGARCDGASDCCRGLACEGGGCCAPRTATCSGSSDCCTGLVCSGGVCLNPDEDLPAEEMGCGTPTERCCAGFTCRAGLVCEEGNCVSCGDDGQACCDGASACLGSLACDVTSGRCVNADPATACGEIDNACCPDASGTPADCSGSLVCRAGTCLRPDDVGFDGAPCGPRGVCDPGLICDRSMASLCSMTPEGCGRDMEECCDVGGSSRACEGALNCQFGECTTCRGPSLTCLLGGILPGQQCCAGSVCRPAPLIPRCCNGQGEACENSLDCCGLMFCGSDNTCQCGRSGSFCVDSSECCEGQTCQRFQCRDAPEMCNDVQSACESSGECCDGLSCSETRAEPTAPPTRQCCAGGGTSCTDNEDCCGRMDCEDGVCECLTRGGLCDRDIECCEADICVAGACTSGDGCERETRACAAVGTPPLDANCCGALRCLRLNPEMEARCCAGADSRCRSDDECCGSMRCGTNEQCQCQMSGMPCSDTIGSLDCCGASLCSDGTCT